MDKCQWYEDDNGVWETTCECTFEFIVDGPDDNGFSFCPFCGLILEVMYD